jgi:minimal PKS ketosynthase (KS/KS alpha)
VKRVVITGIGVIAPLGIGKEEFWRNAFHATSCISHDNEMESMGLKSNVSCRVRDFNLSDFSSGEEFFEKSGDQNAGIIFSSAIGGTPTMQKLFELSSNYGNNPLSYIETGESFYNAGMFNYSASLISKKYGFEGPCVSLSTGCTAGLDSLGIGFEMIRSGDMKVVVSGASEAPLTGLTYSTLDVIGSLSTSECSPERASRPFDAKRGGFVIGEAAAVVVLEELEHALAREANIYAEVVSYASVSNAFHMTDLPDSGLPMAKVIEQTLMNGNVKPSDLDYINAHGSSTPQNDVFETNAYKKVFGDIAYSIPISSTKSMLGHSLSSASLVGVIATVGTLESGVIHPTINYEFPDPLCDLDYVPNTSRACNVRTALLTASGFGGIHSAVILRKHKS